ncbi:hypothetical protein ADIARSV_2677 [Arcticibacter svalbardensis MN12-7]|uniref:Uncharacterized protein n=1 Tax=Arcticibacter svalbardensis MN12-7 TaxID=1150600 RepID=R9GQU3_9SPHI|nr:hypothetical protein ADIARSV_2677 [Arcticibacter svalbardensis MN12-7]
MWLFRKEECSDPLDIKCSTIVSPPGILILTSLVPMINCAEGMLIESDVLPVGIGTVV